MNSIVEMIMQQLSGSVTAQVANKLGISPAAAQQAVAVALPVIVGALGHNASTAAGAGALNQALADHGANGSASNAPSSQDGAGILSHVLGSRQQEIAAGIAKATGLTPEQATSVTSAIAPVVMGALGSSARAQNAGPGQLSGILQGEHSTLDRLLPGAGALAGLFHSGGGGGSLADTIGRLGSQIVGGSAS